MKAWPLVLLLAGCARRERPFVPSAPAPDPAAARLRVAPDGAFPSAGGARRVLLDVPGRLRIRDLRKGFLDAFLTGVRELDALVDTHAGEGAVPLRFPLETSGLAFLEGGKTRRIWNIGESFDLPGARVRPGIDGAYEVLETGSIGDFKVVSEAPVLPGGSPGPQPRKRGPPPALDEARFVLLCAGSDDLFKDVVLSLVELEKRFPGKVVLEVFLK